MHKQGKPPEFVRSGLEGPKHADRLGIQSLIPALHTREPFQKDHVILRWYTYRYVGRFGVLSRHRVHIPLSRFSNPVEACRLSFLPWYSPDRSVLLAIRRQWETHISAAGHYLVNSRTIDHPCLWPHR